MEKDKEKKVITKEEKQILELLSKEKFSENFYLAGGTALALQLYHRISADLDFFSEKYFEPLKISKLLELKFAEKYKTIGREKGTLHCKINNTLISFLMFPYPLLEKKQKRINNIKIAGIKDIAAMKLSSVHGRGTKKDFIDLFFILQKKYTLDDLLSYYSRKFHVLKDEIPILMKSLIYFSDADFDPDPVFLQKCSWDHIKKFFIKEVTKYTSDIFKKRAGRPK